MKVMNYGIMKIQFLLPNINNYNNESCKGLRK